MSDCSKVYLEEIIFSTKDKKEGDELTYTYKSMEWVSTFTPLLEFLKYFTLPFLGTTSSHESSTIQYSSLSARDWLPKSH
jgi:hypothetical protein